jgi:hypothetical protein
MGCRLSKSHKCGLCLSEDCRRRARLCGECMFVRHFIVTHGRDALKAVTSQHAVLTARARSASMPLAGGPRPIQRTHTQTWTTEPMHPFDASAPPYKDAMA